MSEAIEYNGYSLAAGVDKLITRAEVMAIYPVTSARISQVRLYLLPTGDRYRGKRFSLRRVLEYAIANPINTTLQANRRGKTKKRKE